MRTTFPPQFAWAGLGITWVAYVAFVFVTRVENFGLAIEAESLWIWFGMRIATVSFWLAIAATVLYARRLDPNWSSFLHAALATALLAVLLTPTLTSARASLPVIGGSILFYALVSGLVCITFKTPPIAAMLGLLLFPGQLLLDTAAHVLSGIFPLH